MPNSTVNPEKSELREGHPAAWLFVSLAALLLAFGGLSDLDRTTAIWIRCLAGVSTALALIFDPKSTFSGKKTMALLLILTSLGLGMFFQKQVKAPPANAQAQTGLASTTAVPHVDGPASERATLPNKSARKIPAARFVRSSGNQSPAVSGSGNSFGYGVPAAPAKLTAPAAQSSQSPQPAGSASSSGDQSPAVSGSGNSFGYGAPAAPAKLTAPAAQSLQSSQPAGSASSNGDQSPAVSGSGNSFNYGTTAPPPKKKDTEH